MMERRLLRKRDPSPDHEDAPNKKRQCTERGIYVKETILFDGILLHHLSPWSPFSLRALRTLQPPRRQDARSLLQLGATCKAAARRFHSAGLQALIYHLREDNRCLTMLATHLEKTLVYVLQMTARSLAAWPQLEDQA